MSTGFYVILDDPIWAHSPRRYRVRSVIPLAVGGTAVIGVAVAGALLLLAILLRSEDRYDAEQSEQKERER
jgi:hypothetical protein